MGGKKRRKEGEDLIAGRGKNGPGGKDGGLDAC